MYDFHHNTKEKYRGDYEPNTTLHLFVDRAKPYHNRELPHGMLAAFESVLTFET